LPLKTSGTALHFQPPVDFQRDQLIDGIDFFPETTRKRSFRQGIIWKGLAKKLKNGYCSCHVVEACPKLLKKKPIVANVKLQGPMKLIFRPN
jgi:hypothetical protein